MYVGTEHKWASEIRRYGVSQAAVKIVMNWRVLFKDKELNE